MFYAQCRYVERDYDKTFSAPKQSSGFYYKPITIVNDNSIIIHKLETSLIVDVSVIIYNRHMFIVQATDFVQKILDALNGK
jgi:hypothetical protein